MDEDKASEIYWQAVHLLQEVIDSGHRGSEEDILEELEEDLKRRR